MSERVDLRGQLQAIYDEYGKLTPELVAEEAKPMSHPLHNHIYDRSRKDAADAWYLHRAEMLIRSVTIRYRNADGKPVDVRAFSPTRQSEPGVYDPIEKIVQDDVAFKVLLNQMEREWLSMKRRYDHLQEFWDMVNGDEGWAA